MKSSYFSLFHGSHLWNSNKVLQELSSAGGECRTPDSPNSIMASRKILEKEYFMSQLGDCDDDASTDYGYGSKGVELKQKLLHFMVTEAKLANAITPDSPFIVARTDFGKDIILFFFLILLSCRMVWSINLTRPCISPS